MAKGIYYGVKKTLPSGYTQVEYIESTGTQYIDTGFKPNSNTRIVAEMAYVSFTNNTCGLIGSSASSGIEFYYYSSTVSQRYIYMFNATDNNSANTEVALGKKLHIDLAKTKATVTVDGSVYTMTPSSAANFSASYTLHIHTLWRNGAALLGSYSRTYSFMIYDNGTLVRDFIPCKNSSGVGGLYDFVNGVFYADAAGGSFVVGGSVADGSLPSVARKVKKLYRGVENFAKSNLPSGYTQVAYIEGTGTQYIDTGFIPNQDTRFVADIQATSVSVLHLFGARTAQASNSLFGATLSATTARADYADQQNTHTVSSILDRMTWDVGKAGCTIGNTSSTFTADTFSPNVTMALFAANTDGTITGNTYKAKMKLYSCQIYDNGTLVRDFVPCTNSSGTMGLYDMVGGTFYTNAGTGAFVVGDTYKSVARKIKKAYIGIGGVARPFFSGGELAYYGTATALSAARRELAATTVGNYALFGGGYKSSVSAVVDAYDTSLTRTTPTALNKARTQFAATTVGNYALFGGGFTNAAVSYVSAYDISLTRTMADALTVSRRYLAATTVGNYALFGGGYGSGTYNAVNAYDTALTRTTPTALSVARYFLGATTVGNYALFGGGYNSSTSDVVDAYDTSLTRTTPTQLSQARRYLAATTVGNYALFGGGTASVDLVKYNTVDAYNSSLTRTTATALMWKRGTMSATTIEEYALFGGGLGNKDSPSEDASSSFSVGSLAIVDAYDTSLTRTNPTALSQARSASAATTVGNYALFGGGTADTVSSVVDVYTVA